MSSCRVLSEYDVMPWKNGLGVASEIAIFPPGLNFRVENFIFRISRTELTGSRHFSLFRSYERISVRLQGEPMRLRHNKAATVNTIPVLTPYAFKGEWYTESLVDGPAVDINLIYHREKATARVEVITLAKGSNSKEKEVAPTSEYTIDKLGSTFLYCVRGSAVVRTTDAYGKSHDYPVRADETFEAEVLKVPLLLSFTNTSEDECVMLLVDLCAVEAAKEEVEEQKAAEDALLGFEEKTENHDNSLIWKIWNLHEDVIERSVKVKAEKEIISMPKGPEEYRPPGIRLYRTEGDVPPAVAKDFLNLADFPKGELRSAWINMVKNGLGEWIRVPVLVARGAEEGPVLGITAAVHGNELNGVPCIHKVMASLDMSQLRGAVVGVPCVNVDGYLHSKREFFDGVDLNKGFPGIANGTASQKFCYAIMEKIVKPNFTYLIDLHTAAFGRLNSYFVCADLEDPVSKKLALLQQPQIILHDSGKDGTLGGAATKLGIKGITVEIGNPQLLQTQYVQWTTAGIMNVLKYFKMISLHMPASKETIVPIICKDSYWMHTRSGGILEVYPDVNTLVSKGDLVARMKDIFGNYVEEYFAENDGVVIGRSSNPVAERGAQILHLGLISKSVTEEEMENLRQ